MVNLTQGGGYWIPPVGFVWLSTENVSPAIYFENTTWELISQNRVLMGAGNGHAGGDTVEAGLPNITGSARIYSEYNYQNYDVINRYTGAFYWTKELENNSSKTYGTSTNMSGGTNDTIRDIPFDASRSSAIYGRSTTVQPPAFYVYMWRRVS